MAAFYDEKLRFIQTEYARQPAFSGFLPGIAGPWGIPAWCNYVNRGQGVCSFGVQDKDHAILEFTDASGAYRRTPLTGFRTFIKEGGIVTEPFADGKGTMIIEPNTLSLIWTNGRFCVQVLYFTLPHGPMAGLCRRLRVSNLLEENLSLELLDGLAAMVPYGIRDEKLKQEGHLSTAWMQVENLENRLPYYRVRASLEDCAKVTSVEGGNFKLAFVSDGQLLPTIVQPDLIFGWDTALTHPLCFQEHSLKDLTEAAQQNGNFLPCCFTPWAGNMPADQSVVLWEFYGQAENMDAMNSFTAEACRKDYFEAKLRQARQLPAEISAPAKTKTANRVFDGYTAQNFIDNVMRGGFPYSLNGRKDILPVYLYSRKHGDPEREYNYFFLSREYFSQGNAHFRDICQNRRSDVFVNPSAGVFNIRLFFELLQPDGYNPLVLEPVCYCVEHPKELSARLNPRFREKAEELLRRPFSIGTLAMEAEKWHLDAPESFLADVIADSVPEPMAQFQEGYWSDHWTYLLDLLENEAAVFPDKEQEVLFEKPKLRWFAPQASVLPQGERYCMTKKGLRQYRCVVQAPREEKWTLTRNGSTARSTLAEKLLLLCAVKYAALDLSGAAVEMEGGKPGWNDALNGLPGLLGASVAEGCELLRLLEYLLDRMSLFPAFIEVYEEIVHLLEAVYTLDKRDASKFEKWMERNQIRDQYRADTKDGFSGVRLPLYKDHLKALLSRLADSLRRAIQEETEKNGGICPTYFYYEAEETVNEGNGVLPKKLKQATLPLFLEGPARWLKTKQPNKVKEEMIQAVQNSPLFDRKLGMYKLNASLREVPYEVGRARAFPPGWLENESVWLHMEYKYLLSLLECGMYDSFFTAFTAAAIPFLPPEQYKRSTLENSSFLLSSANPDTASHGRGYVARLSGSTAEFISIWNRMLFGKAPFFLENGSLSLRFRPAIPKELLCPEGLMGTFLKSTEVLYHTGSLTELKPGGYRINRYRLYTKDGFVDVHGDTIPHPWALEVREGTVPHIDVYFQKG